MGTKSKKSNVIQPLPSALTVAKPAESRTVKPRAEERASAQAQPATLAKAAPKRAVARSKAAPTNGQPIPAAESTRVAASTAGNGPRKVEVNFLLPEPEAKRVFVCGSFNRWAPDEIPLTKGADGCWTGTVALPIGRYEYKFVVDGTWIPDLTAAEHVPNEFGSLNSVIEVR